MAATLTEQVCEILNDPTLTKMMNYSISGITIRSSMMTDVATAIAKGQVKVLAAAKNVASSYNPKTDTFKVELPLTTYSDKAAVIHEAIHCAQDMRGVSLLRMDDETAAFVGHGIYLRTLDSRFYDGGPVISDGSAKLNMVAALMPIVDLVMGGSKVPDEQLKELKSLIVKVDGYGNCWKKTINHNGLKKKV